MGYIAEHGMKEDIAHFREFGWSDHRIEERLKLSRGTLAAQRRRDDDRNEPKQR